MKILGLTGGMGMWKSTVARMLEKAGMPVFDADAEVHALQAPGGTALEAIGQLVPQAVHSVDGTLRLDRQKLREMALADPAIIRGLEKILHPMVRQARAAFLRKWRRAGVLWVVLDIPLLFETGNERVCDMTVTVSAPRRVQVERVLKRARLMGRQISRQEVERLIARQLPDAFRRRKADAVIRTGLSMMETERAVRCFLKRLRGRDETGGLI